MELTPDEGTYLLAFMMAMADGAITDDESRAIAERLRHYRPPIADERCVELIYAARESYHQPNIALSHVAAAIPPDNRVEALRVALDVLWADDSFDPTEMAALQEFCDALDIDRSVLSRLMEERGA